MFQQAPDLSRILGFDEIQASGVKGREPVDVSNGLNCIRIYSNLVKQMISFVTSPLVDCMIYSTMGLNNVCLFSHLNMPGVCMSDLHSFQFDVRDRHGEVVSIASDIYINKYSVLSVDEKGIFWLYMVATISDLYLSLVW